MRAQARLAVGWRGGRRNEWFTQNITLKTFYANGKKDTLKMQGTDTTGGAGAHLPHTPPPALLQALGTAGHVVYMPNPGNIGDELIALSTTDLMDRLGMDYEVYSENKCYPQGTTLVYGGGGLLAGGWDYTPLMELVLQPQWGRVVILPHSLRGCDDLLERMDGRFTVFCREQASLAYCRARNTAAHFELAHDMALYTDTAAQPELEDLLRQYPRPCIFTRMAERLFAKEGASIRLSHFYRKTHERMNRHLRERLYRGAGGAKLAFFMRADGEAAPGMAETLPPGAVAMDIARYGGGNCRLRHLNRLGVLQMWHCMRQADIIVTDRLHVGISAALLGLPCILADNSYGKISGVYEQSLRGQRGITLCSSAEELRAAIQPYLPQGQPTS